MTIRFKAILLAVLLMPAGVLFAQDAEPPPEPEDAAAVAAEAEAAQDAEVDEPAPAVQPEAEAARTGATLAGGMIPAPPPGKGQIVFFREKKFAGSAIRYKVREGEVELGKLGSGTYFVHVTDPGAHEYTVHSEAKDVLNVEVEEGETLFVIGTVTMGFMAGRPNLSPSDEATFQGMSSDLKPAKPLE